MLPPLIFEPYFRPQIWGEARLQRLLGKPLPPGRIGESWEVSAHPLHVSRVAEGTWAGTKLTDLWKSRRSEFLGLKTTRRIADTSQPPFPLLFKLLDCHDMLSVQVHPDDATAQELLDEPNGKTEAWVVLHAEPGSRIYAGLMPGIDRHELERQLDRGRIDECLHSFEPQPGDGLLIEAGTIHAVGGGVLMAEVQQTSDATFRLFDWNRLGPNGRPRELHREASLRSIHFDSGPVSPIRLEPCRCVSCHDEDLLVRSRYFQVSRVNLRDSVRSLDDEPMSLWMLTSGQAILESDASDYHREFRPGETVLIPANSTGLRWSARQAVLLRIEATTTSGH